MGNVCGTSRARANSLDRRFNDAMNGVYSSDSESEKGEDGETEYKTCN